METNSNENVYIGVDIAKDHFDAHQFPLNQSKTFANSPKGFEQFFQWIKNVTVKLVICEPTGGYENKFVIALADEDVSFRIHHANQIRAYAKSLGILAKIDKIDAKILAQFAAERKLAPQRCIVQPQPERNATQPQGVDRLATSID
jgi:transposase